MTATLDTAREVPRPCVSGQDRRAAGTFRAALTVSGTKGTLAWHLAFAHLSGPATAAHVHLGAPGKAGPVAIPLCGPCTSGEHGVFKGPIGGNATLLRAILDGGTYVNVHTKLNPAGEIRGQVAARLEGRSSTAVKTTTVDAQEREWGIKLSRATVPAGRVTFVVHDTGKLAHQFLVLRTNRPAGSLPMTGTQVDVKAAGTLVGEIRSIEPGHAATATLDLSPGRYVLFCNLPAHYHAGQHAAFRVS